ncbi:gibberellin 20-oxidase [Teratosphaeria destructans]|uniref:Gibberellin 20-oxidase n=1 Tax=Teratosphaeria destructans TaxID=418781 RepID=A0A9W7STN6_9PEZI|nr:gibberellin 20-oxidase [Teratosphaeria destructans]
MDAREPGQHRADVPIVDIRSSNPVAHEELLDAAAKYGFAYIGERTNSVGELSGRRHQTCMLMLTPNDQDTQETGISDDDIREMFQLSQRFFSSPASIKAEVAIPSPQAGKNHGWLGQGVERLDPATQRRPDVKEAFNFGEPVDGHFQQPLPRPLRPHTLTLLAFDAKCHRLCQRILELFAIALDIPRDWFSSRHNRAQGRSGTVFRLLYYPPAEVGNGGDLRAGAHSDYGSITLLFQQLGQPGLEIKTPSGEWAPVPPRADAILVNIGDLLDDWTCGLLKSTVHRVIFPMEEGGGGDRYSIAYFCHPLDDALLEPVPSDAVERHAALSGRRLASNEGQMITARDHLTERLASTYTVQSK